MLLADATTIWNDSVPALLNENDWITRQGLPKRKRRREMKDNVCGLQTLHFLHQTPFGQRGVRSLLYLD